LTAVNGTLLAAPQAYPQGTYSVQAQVGFTWAACLLFGVYANSPALCCVGPGLGRHTRCQSGHKATIWHLRLTRILPGMRCLALLIAQQAGLVQRQARQ
jgi:hypothetical protein